MTRKQLKHIGIGSTFVLTRSGEKYVKGHRYYFRGERTRRFYVAPLFPVKERSFEPTLNEQCLVKEVIRGSNL